MMRMKRFFSCLPLLLLLAGGCGPPPTPEGVMRRTLETYRGLHSFQERATETTEIRLGSQSQSQTAERRFAYEAPNRFYSEVTVQSQPAQAAASDGVTAQSLQMRRGVVTAPAPARLAGSQDLLTELQVDTQAIPLVILLGGDPLAGARVKLGSSEDIEGQSMQVLEMSRPDGSRSTFWIGKNDHLLHRDRQFETVRQNSMSFTRETTVNHTDLQVNPQLEAQVFALRVPPGVPTSELLVGRPAPAFDLKALDGKQMALASLRGKLVVLNFWAFW
jgi:outer membrane lipoprotein-sorting protein